MYRISGFRVPADSGEGLKELLERKMKTRVGGFNIVRESIDARDREKVCLVYTVDFDAGGMPRGRNISKAPAEENYRLDGEFRGELRPVVCGFGPAGMFAALILAECGAEPLVIERGKSTDERVRDVEDFFDRGRLNPESNVCFGEGGAGAFSDGKLVSGIRDPRKRLVFERLVRAGAPAEIMYEQKPHIGTDLLRKVIVNMRKEIERLGGEIRFASKLTAIETEGNRIRGIVINGRERLECRDLILATGHSARDTFAMLKESGADMERKPFSIGVRIEHRQEMIDEALYGRFREYLPHGEYRLAHHCRCGRGTYTFCMCPGGMVIPAASEEGYAVTNGMSYHDRGSGYANSALLVDVRPEDFDGGDVLAGVEFQRKYERAAYEINGYSPVSMTWGEYAAAEDNDLDRCLPGFVRECYLESMPVFGGRIKGFDRPDAVLKGIETRSSSPVRIKRDRRGMSNIEGLYPCGEGAGYAGGITSAAVDGIRIAELALSRYM